MTASAILDNTTPDRSSVIGPEPAWRRRAINIEALRSEARRALPRAVFDFVDGGAEDDLGLLVLAHPAFAL